MFCEKENVLLKNCWLSGLLMYIACYKLYYIFILVCRDVSVQRKFQFPYLRRHTHSLYFLLIRNTFRIHTRTEKLWCTYQPDVNMKQKFGRTSTHRPFKHRKQKLRACPFLLEFGRSSLSLKYLKFQNYNFYY